VLPSGLAGPADDPLTAPEPAANVTWLQVIPDSWVDDPAVVVTSRENVRLALVASLQHLPAQQRAVLLRDVLAFPAADVAAMLDISAVAVKSALQRARARMQDVAPSTDDVIEPTATRARELLERYMAAFEAADTTLLEEALRHDAALEMVGARTWFAGRATCLPYLAGVVGVQGDWRMVAIAANGQPAAAPYRRDDDGVLRAFGIAVLDVTATGIARVVVFGDPGLVTLFGLPLIDSPLEVTLVDRTVTGARHHDVVARYAGKLNGCPTSLLPLAQIVDHDVAILASSLDVARRGLGEIDLDIARFCGGTERFGRPDRVARGHLAVHVMNFDAPRSAAEYHRSGVSVGDQLVDISGIRTPVGDCDHASTYRQQPTCDTAFSRELAGENPRLSTVDSWRRLTDNNG